MLVLTIPSVNGCHNSPPSVERVSPEGVLLKIVFSSTATAGNISNVIALGLKPNSVHVFPPSVERKLSIPNTRTAFPVDKTLAPDEAFIM